MTTDIDQLASKVRAHFRLACSTGLVAECTEHGGAYKAFDTLVSRLKEAEGKLRIVKDAHRRVSPDGEWTFPVTLKPNEVADIISFLSTPPNQETEG